MAATEQGVPETLSRPCVPALDAILGKPFPVLDQGFVRLIDYMGDEAAVVQAARTSYGKGTKKVSEDRGLLRYLMRHWHTTPFEMAELKVHVRVPMDCWRQWIRHRTASVNEYSTRYSEAIDACQRTPKGEWRYQAKGNRQGSAGFFPVEPDGLALSVAEEQLQKKMRAVYQQRLDAGVAREQARKDLPLSNYTEAYWKIDLKNLLGFLGLRMDLHAQKEIRDYADVIGEEMVKLWLPNVWEAFNDYHPLRDAMTLTRLDIDVISALNSEDRNTPKGVEQGGWVAGVLAAHKNGWIKFSKKNPDKLVRNRERDECEAKLTRLGLRPPWNAKPHLIKVVIDEVPSA